MAIKRLGAQPLSQRVFLDLISLLDIAQIFRLLEFFERSVGFLKLALALLVREKATAQPVIFVVINCRK